MYRYVFILIIVVLSLGCREVESNIAKDIGEMNNNTKKEGINKDYEDGDIFSKERWERILKGLKNVKIGMKRTEVIEILGYPDGIRYAPMNIMQYSVAFGVYDDQPQTVPVHITLNNDQEVIEIKRSDFVYGPPPQESVPGH